MARPKKDKVKNHQRGSTGLLYEHQDRYFKLLRIKNDGNAKFSPALQNVVTFKEAEIIFKLPYNTIVQDYKNGLMRKSQVRKSANTYLITLKEAKNLYENYWTTRAAKNVSHLYSSLDGKKMSEDEYFIRFGDINTQTSEYYEN